MTSIAIIAILIYAIFIIVGGGIGYLKSKSRVSLFSGVGSGILLIIARVIAQSAPTAGLGIALGSAIALALVFSLRLRKTGKFMPAGLLAIVSGIATIIFILGLVN